MKRFIYGMGREVERPDVDAFLAEVDAVCRRHGFCIEHEDGQGSFLVCPYADGDSEWLQAAAVVDT